MQNRIILFAVIIILFVSCSPKPKKAEVEAYNQIDPSSIEIFFYHQGLGEMGNLWESMAQGFTESNPWGIEVIPVITDDLESAGSGLQLVTEAGVSIPTGSVVDLFPLYSHPDWGIVNSILSEDLEDLYLVKNDKWNIPFLPVLRDMNVLYINTDETEIPVTPEELWKQDVFVFPGEELTLSTLFFSLGGRLRDSKGHFESTREDWNKSFDLIDESINQDLAVVEEDKYQGQIQFSSGIKKISLDALSGLPYYERSIKAFGSDFNWKLAEYPIVEEGRLTLEDLGIYITANSLEESLASWLFYLYLLEPENQAFMIEHSGLLPVAVLEDDADDYLRDHPFYTGIYDVYLISKRVVMPRNGIVLDFIEELREEFIEILVN